MPATQAILSEWSKLCFKNFYNYFFCPQSKVEDIHVVCGLLKDFFRKLAEPLVTYKLWSAFVDAASKTVN